MKDDLELTNVTQTGSETLSISMSNDMMDDLELTNVTQTGSDTLSIL